MKLYFLFSPTLEIHVVWDKLFSFGSLVFSKARNDQEKIPNLQHHRRPKI